MILLTLLWIVEEVFWVAIWVVGFAIRFMIGTAFFLLGMLIGFRMFIR